MCLVPLANARIERIDRSSLSVGWPRYSRWGVRVAPCARDCENTCSKASWSARGYEAGDAVGKGPACGGGPPGCCSAQQRHTLLPRLPEGPRTWSQENYLQAVSVRDVFPWYIVRGTIPEFRLISSPKFRHVEVSFSDLNRNSHLKGQAGHRYCNLAISQQ